MKARIMKCIRGDNQFKMQLLIRNDDDAYNTFPLHVFSVMLMVVIAMQQGEWNMLSVCMVAFVAVDMSIISYRLGYQDMKRHMKMKEEINEKRSYRI